MRHGRSTLLAVLVLLAAAAPAAHAADDSRYALVNGCYDLTSGGKAVETGIGPFRMQATALGDYLLYGKKADFLAKSGATVDSAGAPSDDANWTVDGTTGAFTLTLATAKQD